MKTTEEIYNEIIAEKESGNYPELDELNSTSKVSIWRLWVWIFAFFSKSLLELYEGLKLWIIDFFSKNQIGTIDWWISELKQYQYADELEFINGKFQYAIIDETKQIIKQAAIEVQDRFLLIKVASDDGNNNLIPLTSSQITAIEGYVHKIKLPGTFTTIISQEPAQVNISFRIYYNAEIPQATIQQQIENVINNYLNNLVFNAKYVITTLTDEIQNIEGIINPVHLLSEAKEQYSVDWVQINDYYISVSGYMKLNNLILEFISNV